MQSIINACEPRQDILAGTFNPEIFTASISEVFRFYSGDGASIHPMYTDAGTFFREATYPTDGLKMILSDVFTRISGNSGVPAIHRLETAFGGGKTHALIACAHIAYKGKEITAETAGMLDSALLPNPGEVSVVGVAGDEIPVHKPKGAALTPYTLWGEMAYQIGGEALYREVEDEAAYHAAPGKGYLDKILGGRKILVMLDELAQYAARLSAASPAGASQLAAFLMGLHGYARTHAGISVLVTLASATDAFATETEQLTRALSEVTGEEIDRDKAIAIGQEAVKDVSSVVFRDASPVVPVQAAEISRVLAKRLFTQIDRAAAQQVAEEYAAMYQKSSSLLPAEATRVDYRDRMVAHYPFHPTLLDYLNNKLATSENFQGTRGVLRVLSLAVRSLWKRKRAIPMIHAGHLDLRDSRIVNELVGRTGSGDLLPVLNADIGGTDTEGIQGGISNAEFADEQNPHPEGWPMHEYTWKTVFLHSLVGRDEGLGSNLFGITEQDALFHISFPGLTPPQVAEALEEIEKSAYYLRKREGRFFASLDPSVNIALAKLRRSLSAEEVDDLLDTTARKVVSSDIKTFQVVHDVISPEHIPDKQGKPVLALVALGAEDINVEGCITTAGPNRPRIEQNLVLVLVPETVEARTGESREGNLFNKAGSPMEAARRNLRDLARLVRAMRKLSENPHNHGINPKRLDEEDFKKRFRERDNALITAVSETYKHLWYPSAKGKIVSKEIRTGGGESGVSVLEQIRKTLLEEGELITADQVDRSTLINLKNLFFARTDVVSIFKLQENFCRVRSWPILDTPDVLDQLLREGVRRGTWCLFRMGSEESTIPEAFYSQETDALPLDLELQNDFSIITPEGARKRGWGGGEKIDPVKLETWVRQTAAENQAATFSTYSQQILEVHGEIKEDDLKQTVADQVRKSRIIAYKGMVDQEERPELIHGTPAAFYNPEPEDVLITPRRAVEKGWMKPEIRGISLDGKKGAETLFPLLRRLGSFYQKGGKTTIDLLDLTELELPKGGALRVTLSGVPSEAVKDLEEFFEVLAGVVQMGEKTEAYLDLQSPQDDCPFVEEVKKAMEKG